MRVRRDPLFVVQRRWRGRLVDERRLAPAQLPSRVEGPLVDSDRVRRSGAVEAETRVKHMASAVERECRVATGVIDPAGESLDTRDERSELARIARRAAPRCAAVVREVRPGVAVAERAARSAAHRAAPRARDIVIGRRDDAQRVVRVDRDRGLVLRCRSGVLIHQDCGCRDGRPVERAREHVRGRDRRGGGGGVFLGRLLLDERGKPDLQARGAVHRGDFAGERVEVVRQLIRVSALRSAREHGDERRDTQCDDQIAR